MSDAPAADRLVARRAAHGRARISSALYQPSPETKDYWDGVARHELRLKWCPRCRKAHHPKRIVCTFCGNSRADSARASGRGTVYSFSEVHRAAIDAFAKAAPYIVGVVRWRRACTCSRASSRGRLSTIDAPVTVDFRRPGARAGCCRYSSWEQNDRRRTVRHPGSRRDTRAGRTVVHDGARRSRR